MMFKILTLFFIALSQASSQAVSPVALDVYYETLCPDSINFIKNQLYSTWEKLANTGILNVRIFPYGNAHQSESGDGSWIFECQHGENECYLNSIHGCVMKRVDFSAADYLPFVFCNEMSDDPMNSVQSCLEQHLSHIQLEDLQTCAQGPEGNALMHDFGLATDALNPSHNWIPWMVVNNEHTDSIQTEAEYNLLNFVCTTYIGETPAECSNI